MPCNGGPWSGGDDCEDLRRKAVWFEKQACAARWLVLQLATRAGRLTGRLRAAVAVARREQLAHRKADRQELVVKINNRLADLVRREHEIVRLGGSPSGEIRAERRRWRAEVARVRAMTDDQLLATYFGNEPRFKELD